ncbi:3-oxoacyl-[acyl-carrier-protein] reductase FabG-like [Aplysia californica]|uniref:3-oxoacyl-[acyl-carrier-protein] reductase FabG-like n=1 Tax=Aplysia californica TaxID=6500 RepID=A0ABM1A4X7_APLCA|nr:3-oxoacyl-[acyl-carrier-protein] reductase FabG-like [Aplysia californica]
MTKAALEHLTRLTALEVAESGVRVNAVVPGFVVTDTMLYNFPEDQKSAMEERFIASAKKSQPLGGGLRMSAVAKSIHFLVSDGACSITGECVRVDNGCHLAVPEGTIRESEMVNSGLYNSRPTQERQAGKKEAKDEHSGNDQ